MVKPPKPTPEQIRAAILKYRNVVPDETVTPKEAVSQVKQVKEVTVPTPPQQSPQQVNLQGTLPEKNKVYCGDNVEVMSKWPPNCIDGVVTDFPYGLEFQGEEWDKVGASIEKTPTSAGGCLAYSSARIRYGKNTKTMEEQFRKWGEAILRVTKPGGYMLAFGGSRTHHRLMSGLEDAGWEIKDCIIWLYSQGFPHSHNISLALDKSNGIEQPEIAPNPNVRKSHEGHVYNLGLKQKGITAPVCELAKAFEGYGTSLKPAYEIIVIAMKPVDKTYAKNAEKWGIAGLNIDDCRIGGEDGRWPANVMMDEGVGAFLDQTNKTTKSVKSKRGDVRIFQKKEEDGWIGESTERGHNDSGGPSRFFYCSKASKSEKEFEYEGKVVKSSHPTHKPVKLMKYLCMLLKSPTGGIILDPFGGSGTTGVACVENGQDYILIEKEPEYIPIGELRIKNAMKKCMSPVGGTESEQHECKQQIVRGK